MCLFHGKKIKFKKEVFPTLTRHLSVKFRNGTNVLDVERTSVLALGNRLPLIKANKSNSLLRCFCVHLHFKRGLLHEAVRRCLDALRPFLRLKIRRSLFLYSIFVCLEGGGEGKREFKY